MRALGFNSNILLYFACLEEVNTPAETLGTKQRKFYPQQLTLEGARYIVPSEPGLGVEFYEEFAKSLEFRPIEIPILWKNDVSYTNW